MLKLTLLLLIIILGHMPLICGYIYERNPFYHNSRLPILGRKLIGFLVDVLCVCFVIRYGLHFYPFYPSLGIDTDIAILIANTINTLLLLNVLKTFALLIAGIFEFKQEPIRFFSENIARPIRDSIEILDDLLWVSGLNDLRSKEPISDYSVPQFDHNQYLLGDQACINNARSEYLQCAVNPSGDCGDCKHREVEETTIEVDRTNKQAYMFAEVLKYMQGVDSFSVSCRKLGLEVQLFLEDGGRYKLTDLVDAWADEDFIYDWLKSLTKIQ
jgi:Family of unknown function (DUF6464)